MRTCIYMYMYVHTYYVLNSVCSPLLSSSPFSSFLPSFSLSQVEVTKFEDLEETHSEVKLKQTLWQSQKDWATDYETWLNVS